MDRVSFCVEASEPGGRARAGRLSTPHGVLETPAFFPVGTRAAVRGITPEELRAVGVQGVLANTFHLHLRPGEDLIAGLGGLHGFMGWDGPILTDSGGYQVYSLAHLARRSEEGVRFRSPVDGSSHLLTPESCIEIQQALGADLICILDEFDAIGEGPQADARARDGLERTLRWAERARRAHTRPDQLLFGIVQGGGSTALRTESAERTRDLGFEAFAIGGLGVGDSAEARVPLLDAALAPLRADVPRYLMGLGEPDDLLAAIGQGVDLFDCVVPTRNGRHGLVFTREGRLNLRNARHRDDPGPLEEDCACPACAAHSRAYLHHLLRVGEALGPRLASLHNIAFYMRLLREVREAIADGSFAKYDAKWRARYRSRSAESATDSAA